MLAVFDYDVLIHKIGYACEKRHIVVRHKETGWSKEFKNITEFWGRGKKIGGWLGEKNARAVAKGKPEASKEDFEYETIRVADEIQNALYSLKVTIERCIVQAGATEYMGYIGKGDPFRVNLSTLQKYKGSRDPNDKPILKDELINYLIKHHNAILVSELPNHPEYDEPLEADDWVNIECYKDLENTVAITNDKDARGCGINTLDPTDKEGKIVDNSGFGEIWRDEKGDVRGYGRKFFYLQVMYGDPVDDYSAYLHSDTPWGPVSAFNHLETADDDLECLYRLREGFKLLYPEPKEIVSWQGDPIIIDWFYVFNEMWQMARMLRTIDDVVDLRAVLEKHDLWED